MTSFTLGVNYWPRRKAMYWWNNFDEGEVREEFSIIKEIGMNVVRIFLLWDDFQPEPTEVSSAALVNLATVADVAAGEGLGLDVTFFTGHMSGPNWSPRWLLCGDLPPAAHKHWLRDVVSQGKKTDQGYRNMFHDEVALLFDAMTTPRVYRLTTVTPDGALRLIARKSGEMFDPLVVKAFVRAMGIYPVGTMVKLDTGEHAVVTRQNEQCRLMHRPVVSLLREGGASEEQIDLAERSGDGGAYRRTIVESVHDKRFEAQKARRFVVK